MSTGRHRFAGAHASPRVACFGPPLPLRIAALAAACWGPLPLPCSAQVPHPPWVCPIPSESQHEAVGGSGTLPTARRPSRRPLPALSGGGDDSRAAPVPHGPPRPPQPFYIRSSCSGSSHRAEMAARRGRPALAAGADGCASPRRRRLGRRPAGAQARAGRASELSPRMVDAPQGRPAPPDRAPGAAGGGASGWGRTTGRRVLRPLSCGGG